MNLFKTVTLFALVAVMLAATAQAVVSPCANT